MATARRLLVLALLLGPVTGRAEVAVCVEVAADPGTLPGLRRLVLDELRRYRSHRVVEAGCASRLHVELFEFAGRRFLTVRVNDEVPIRHAVKPDEIAAQLAQSMKLALRSDPAHLVSHPADLSALQRMAYALKRGRTMLRLELLESVARSQPGVNAVPGGAFALTRGAEHWQVFARVHCSGGTEGPAGDRRALRWLAGADAGLTYEMLARALASPYLSVGLGVQLLEYEGRDAVEADRVDKLVKVGVVLSGRVGVRVLRHTNFDLDLFFIGYLPFFKTNDPDVTVIDRYTPSFQVGLGVGF